MCKGKKVQMFEVKASSNPSGPIRFDPVWVEPYLYRVMLVR